MKKWLAGHKNDLKGRMRPAGLTLAMSVIYGRPLTSLFSKDTKSVINFLQNCYRNPESTNDQMFQNFFFFEIFFCLEQYR